MAGMGHRGTARKTKRTSIKKLVFHQKKSSWSRLEEAIARQAAGGGERGQPDGRSTPDAPIAAAYFGKATFSCSRAISWPPASDEHNVGERRRKSLRK